MTLEQAFETIRSEIDRHDYGKSDITRKSALILLDSLEEHLKNVSHLPSLNPLGKSVVRDEEGKVIGLQG